MSWALRGPHMSTAPDVAAGCAPPWQLIACQQPLSVKIPNIDHPFNWRCPSLLPQTQLSSQAAYIAMRRQRNVSNPTAPNRLTQCDGFTQPRSGRQDKGKVVSCRIQSAVARNCSESVTVNVTTAETATDGSYWLPGSAAAMFGVKRRKGKHSTPRHFLCMIAVCLWIRAGFTSSCGGVELCKTKHLHDFPSYSP